MPRLALPAAPSRAPFLAAAEGQITSGVDSDADETRVSQIHAVPETFDGVLSGLKGVATPRKCATKRARLSEFRTNCAFLPDDGINKQT